jgi:hypothetical protein
VAEIAPTPELEVTVDVQAAGWPLLKSIEGTSERLDALEATFSAPHDRSVEGAALADVLGHFGDAWVLKVQSVPGGRVPAYRGLWRWPGLEWAAGGNEWEMNTALGPSVAGLAAVPSQHLKDAIAHCLDASGAAILVGAGIDQAVATDLIRAALVADGYDFGLLALHGTRAGLLVGRLVIDGATDQVALQLFAAAGWPLLL